MARIVPQKQDRKQVAPSWIDVTALKAVSATDKKMEKTSSHQEPTHLPAVTQYACSHCPKTFNHDHPEVQSQIRKAQRETKEGLTVIGTLTCPSCGGGLSPYKHVAVRRTQIDRRATDSFVKQASETYNTVLDRHVVFKALQTLQDFAAKMGMLQARARFIKSSHDKVAGQDMPFLHDIDCELEWTLTPKLKTRVFATISIDPAGRFRMPKVFKTADNKEYPFDEETIAKIEKSADVFRTPPEPRLRRTDVPQYRKPDPMRFKAASNKGPSKSTIVRQAYLQAHSSGPLTQKEDIALAKFVSLSKNLDTKTELVALAKNLFGDLEKGIGQVVSNHLNLIKETDDENLENQLMKVAMNCDCGKEDCPHCSDKKAEGKQRLPFPKKAEQVDAPPPPPQQQTEQVQPDTTQQNVMNFGQGVVGRIDKASDGSYNIVMVGPLGQDQQFTINKLAFYARFLIARNVPGAGDMQQGGRIVKQFVEEGKPEHGYEPGTKVVKLWMTYPGATGSSLEEGKERLPFQKRA